MTALAFPHSRDLERGLLGALTLEQRSLASVSAVLDASDFYDPFHADLFKALIRINQQGQRYDQTLLVELLPKFGFDLQSIGGVAGFLEMGDRACLDIQAINYADEIKLSAMKRSVLRELGDLTSMMHRPDLAPIEQIDHVLAKLVTLRSTNTQRKSVSIRNAVLKVVEEAEDLKANGGVIRGIETGFAAIDKGACNFPGFWPGELIVLCGHTSHGKSTFALNVSLKAIKRGIPVAYFSAEMSPSSLARRLVSIESEIDATVQRAGLLCEEVQDTWDRVSERLTRLPMHIVDGGVTIEEVAAHSKIIDTQFRAEFGRGVGLIVVDYLQRLRPSDSRVSREEQVAHMSWSAKSLAMQMEVPVLALAQPNREAFRSTDKRPKLHHLRDSGRIEQDADTVMSVYWPWKERDKALADSEQKIDLSVYQVEILKCRNGALGDAHLTFDPRCTKLRDWIGVGRELGGYDV